MMDQLVNQKAQMCYMSSGKVKVSMVLRSPCGATNRRAQHTQSFEGIFIHISGLKVLSPSTHYYAKSMIKHAIRDDNPPRDSFRTQTYYTEVFRKEKAALQIYEDVSEDD